MQGWFERSNLDPVLNNAGPCGRKRHFSKRGAEEVEKRSRHRKSRQYRYKCSLCHNFHMTSLPQYNMEPESVHVIGRV